MATPSPYACFSPSSVESAASRFAPKRPGIDASSTATPIALDAVWLSSHFIACAIASGPFLLSSLRVDELVLHGQILGPELRARRAAVEVALVRRQVGDDGLPVRRRDRAASAEGMSTWPSGPVPERIWYVIGCSSVADTM